MAADREVLISGAGIAGLTLGVLLKQQGYDVLIVERDAALPREGYMMDFFGSGWDVAERMDLVGELHALKYPIDALQFVDAVGHVYANVPISRISRALDGKYVYLRRPDLLRILHERAQNAGVQIRFDTEIANVDERGDCVRTTFSDGSAGEYALLFGADGVHSKVRSLVFGDESHFTRFLGAYVAAFHLSEHNFPVGRALSLHEEIDRIAAFYPLDERRLDATYVFRHTETEVARGEELGFVRKAFAGSGWIGEDVLNAYSASTPIYFDTLTQIALPRWTNKRVALLGDACGCLTLLAGQGSHMAMAGAYVIAAELAKRYGNHVAAFAAYEAKLRPAVSARQESAAMFARYIMPSATSRPQLRRLAIKCLFSPVVLPFIFRWFGSKSILEDYH